MKRFNLIIVFLIISFFGQLYSQQISSVQSIVTSDNRVKVFYKVSGLKFYQTLTISLYVSRDEGKTFIGPLKDVTGDVGEGIRDGERVIFWDAIKELPFVNEELVFEVRADLNEDEAKRSFFVSYVGNDVTYIGLRLGIIGKTGFYVEARMNPISFESVEYTYTNGDLTGYDQPGYYEFTDAKGYSAFSVLGGITFQPARSIFLYGGIGYGWDRYLYEITNYSYDNNSITGTSNVVHSDYDIQGFEIDAGMMYRFKKILFTAGATALNFENIGWTAGVGYSF